MHPVGKISCLWRYPVKSMLGERCDALMLDSRGAEGDRLFAIRDRSGKLGSGKNSRRFHKIDGLLELQAHCDSDNVPAIRFPSGTVMRGDDAAFQQALSRFLGQPVTLVREGRDSHFDDAPIHVVTSASLSWLRATLPDALTDERRFRPNVVVDWPGDGLAEQDWIGKRLLIGDQVQLLIRAATERCGMVAFAQGDLPRDPSVLGHITRELARRFGVYAEVTIPGRIQMGDLVTLADGRSS